MSQCKYYKQVKKKIKVKVEEVEEKLDKPKVEVIKPFLKYAGGKMKVLPELIKRFPKDCKRFIEPFLGAGSVALNVEYPFYIVNDTNANLISAWTELKEKGMDFINECEELFKAINNTKIHYYELREEFNKTKSKSRKAVLLVFLNRHCFNGLCRYNASGKFNTPRGSYKNPVYFPRKEFEACLSKVAIFDIHCKDFREIFEMVESGDVVYCDPPYLPLSASSNFDTYSSGGFGLEDQWELAKCAEKAMDKGAVVIVSNHYNWYSKELYNKAKISKIEVSRVISSKTEKREPVSEIIAVFDKNT